MEAKYKDLISRLERLNGNLSRAIAAKQILLTADNEHVIKSLDYTYEAQACSFLLSSARNELILALRRILEPESKDKCSFKKLIKMRKDQELEKHIKSNILNSPEHDDELATTEQDIQEFEKKYKVFEKDNGDLIKDIRTFRDYHLAHTLNDVESAEFEKEKIVYSDLFSLLDTLCSLFEEFTRLVKVGCFDNTSKNNVWKNYSSQFWLSLSRGMDSAKK